MRNERGSAVLVVLTMLAVLTALILVNGNTIQQLRRELRRIDEQQTSRWQTEKR
jgi:type II secretory pathway component PulK